jgi:hypothetical protein
MRLICTWLLALVVIVTTGLTVRHPAAAQAPPCLHGADETPDQRARKVQAMRFVRHVNTLQAQHARSGGYRRAEGLVFSEALPPGFALRLTSDGESYAFSVIDANDPCRFGFFSNEGGVIHQGEVIR